MGPTTPAPRGRMLRGRIQPCCSPGTTAVGGDTPRYRRCRDRWGSTLRRGSRHWGSPRCPRRSPRRRGCCRCRRRRSGRVRVSTHPCRCTSDHPVCSFQFELGERGKREGGGTAAAAPRTARLKLFPPPVSILPLSLLQRFSRSSVSHQPITVTQEKHHNKLFPRTLEFKQKPPASLLRPAVDGAKANTPAAGRGGGTGVPATRWGRGQGWGSGWDEWDGVGWPQRLG